MGIRSILFAIATISVGAQCGCIIPIVVKAADSVVHVRHESRPTDDPVPMGLRCASHGTHANRRIFIAYGAFPDEHRTNTHLHILGTIAHPHPDYDRTVCVNCPDTAAQTAYQRCRVRMLLERGWPASSHENTFDAYEADVHLRIVFTDTSVSAELPGVRLVSPVNPTDVIHMNGTVLIPHNSDHCYSTVDESLESFERDWSRTLDASADEAIQQ